MKQDTAMEFPKLNGSGALVSSEEGEIFGVILSRSRSVSSASTVVLRAEKQSSALKRAFSMKRSRSKSSSSYCVSAGRGGYYKIFHHFEDPDPVAVDNVAIKSRKKRSSKIFEACKRLIGF